MSKYKAVIGLEMHCEMKSNMKVFSTSANEFNDMPNSNVSPVDMAFPGTLPRHSAGPGTRSRSGTGSSLLFYRQPWKESFQWTPVWQIQ